MTQALKLVCIRGEPFDPPAEVLLDPHMAIDGHGSLVLSHVHDIDGALHYLGHRILQHPNELRSHIQRILLLVRRGDGASLYGAMLDLLIVLSEGGHALKRRMLDLAKPLLTRTSHTFLSRHLESGIRPCDPALARVRSSLLRVGFCGNDKLVRRVGDERQEKRDVLDEAREMVQFGQLDLALETLENSLLINPDQPEVARELLELYVRMGQDARLEAMREQMLINFGSLPEAWVTPVS